MTEFEYLSVLVSIVPPVVITTRRPMGEIIPHSA